MSRNRILAIAAGAALVALVFFFGQSLFERGENVRVERVESAPVSEGSRSVAPEVRTEVLPTEPGDEGRAAQRDQEEKKAERQ